MIAATMISVIILRATPRRTNPSGQRILEGIKIRKLLSTKIALMNNASKKSSILKAPRSLSLKIPISPLNMVYSVISFLLTYFTLI